MFKPGKFTSNIYTIRDIFESVPQIWGVMDTLRGKKSFLKIQKFRKKKGRVQNFSEKGDNLKGLVSSERGSIKLLSTMCYLRSKKKI